MSRQWLGICTRNFKFVALKPFSSCQHLTTKIKGSHETGHAPFLKRFEGACLDCPWKQAHQI